MKKRNPERRHYVRVGTSILVSYKVIGGEKKAKGITAKNISGSGIKIPAKKKLKLGVLLGMKLNFLNENKTITLKTKVIRVNPNRSSKKYPYEIGLEFIDIDLTQRTKLSNCVQYLDRERLLEDL